MKWKGGLASERASEEMVGWKGLIVRASVWALGGSCVAALASEADCGAIRGSAVAGSLGMARYWAN